MRYDVIVIGAGSAGSTLAAPLSEDPRCSVLLLEAGPDYPVFEQLPEDLKWGNNGLRSALGPHTWDYTAIATSENPQPISIPRGKVMGGTSAINGLALLRGLPEDYDHWADLGNAEWSFGQVLPYFRKLERDLDFADDFHGTDGPLPVRRARWEDLLPHAQAFHEACLAEGFPACPDHNHPQSTGIAVTPSNINDEGVRMSTALAYLDPARDRPNLTIRANVSARRLRFAGNQAIGVEAERAGETFTMEGEQIVLCAGAIASPHLLLLSGVGPAEPLRRLGIAVVQDLPGVGRNLRDHPYAMALFQETGPRPADRLAVNQIMLRYTATGSKMRNDMQIGPAPLDGSYLNLPVANGENYCIIYASIQNSASIGELKLTSADPHVQPAIHYRYLSEPWDRERLREGIRIVLRMSERPALRRLIVKRVTPTEDDLATEAALDTWLCHNVGAGYHSAGTCKMGPVADPMAVVDQYCRVHGIAGLRVVDASVMPELIRANTNATIIMIAERVADWIKEGR